MYIVFLSCDEEEKVYKSNKEPKYLILINLG